MARPNAWKVGVLLVFAAAISVAAPVRTFKTIASFGGTNGARPDAVLVQGTDGNFYGTTVTGSGNSYNGAVFKVTPAGKLTMLYRFCSQTNCVDGSFPYAGLVQATDGNFYGTTEQGGANNNDSSCFDSGCGTVFKITSTGKLTTLYSFCAQSNCSDGSAPVAALVQARSGNLYGTTAHGGANVDAGTVFRITPRGDLTTIYNFCSQSNCTDGGAPQAGLIQAKDGNLYGTTISGGAHLGTWHVRAYGECCG